MGLEYTPAIGRWHVPDPLAEWHFKNTPYNYCINNPVRFIDPFGLDTTYYVPPLPEVVVTPRPKPRVDGPDPMNSDASYQDSWLQRFFNWFKIPKGNHNPKKTRYEKGAFEHWALRLNEETKNDFIKGLGSPGIGPQNTLYRLPPKPGEETSDEIIKGTSDQKIHKENKTDGSGVEYGKGKYKNWKRTESLVGHAYIDATEDSLLYVFRGDSTLWISDVKGDWRKNGRYRIKTSDKK